MALRIKDRYLKQAVPALMTRFSYKNVMQVPKLDKIVLNVGLGEAIQNIKLLDGIQKEMTAIAGQKAVVTKAKKSIAGFKLREGMPIATGTETMPSESRSSSYSPRSTTTRWTWCTAWTS
jgi:large subunit ribosomal protein L5